MTLAGSHDMQTIERLLYVLDQIHAAACNASHPNADIVIWAEAGLNGTTGPGETAMGTIDPEAARVDPFSVQALDTARAKRRKT